MNRSDLDDLEEKIMDEFAKRRALGGFDANAATILLLIRWVYELTRHLKDKEPKSKEAEVDLAGARVELRPKKK
jgi:hypothetical protein